MAAKADMKDLSGKSLAPAKAPAAATEQVGNLRVTKDDHGIIINVTGGETRHYTRQATGKAYYPSIMGSELSEEEQSGDVVMVWDGDVVYMRNMISLYKTTNSWMKGTKNGNTISFATRQPVLFSTYYYVTTSVSWAVLTETELKPVEEMETITYTIDGNNITLNTPEGDKKYVIGIFWDDDRLGTGYCDENTALVFNPEYDGASYQMVDLPEGAVVEEWYFNAVAHPQDGPAYPMKNTKVNVALVGNEVYLQNISSNIPNAWVKGVIDGNSVSFANGQYLGNDRDDLWFVGTNGAEPPVVMDVAATYDSENKVFTFSNDYLVNGAHNTVYYVEWYSSVEICKEKKFYPEPIITELTTTLPYLNTFETEAEQNEAAIYDANSDNATFSIYYDYNISSTVARYYYHSSNDGDDYLVFPGVELEAGSTYSVNIDAKSANYSERFEIVAGEIAKASEMNITVIEPTLVENSELMTFSNEKFSVEKDGTYFIAIHAISDANKFTLDFDNFSIAKNDPLSPKVVTDLVVVADEKGAKKATLSFVLPSENISDEALSGDLNIKITCDGVEAYTDTKPVGSAVECEVAVQTNGTHTFAVTTEYDNHVSKQVTASAYVGEDLPTKVVNIKGFDRNDKVQLTWEAPKTGYNGGPINPDHLTYTVYPVNMIEMFGMKFPQVDMYNPIATGITETTYTFDYETNVGEQDMTYFALAAVNELGESETDYAYVLTGEAYKMPFHEMFPNYNNTYWWERDCDDETYAQTGGSFLAEYGDVCTFTYYGIPGGWVFGQTGKISLDGAANPTVTFDYVANTAAKISVIVTSPEGNTLTKSFVSEKSEDFNRVKMSLAEFADQPWVRLAVRAEFEEKAFFSYTNVNVLDLYDVDLEASLSAPGSVTAKSDIDVVATVRNLAEAANSDYAVKVYANDELVKEFDGSELAFFETGEFSVSIPTSVFNLGETVVKVVVESADDKNLANNEVTAMVDIVAPDVAPVESVNAKEVSDGVLVEWEMTDDLPIEYTETFEKNEMYDQEVEGWTLVDADGAPIGYMGSLMIPFSTASWFAFDQRDETLSLYTSYNAYSGNIFMSTLYNSDGSQNDDWMISPELPGMAQTITFQARTATGAYASETMEFLYSTTDKELSSFISLDKQEVPYDVEYPSGKGIWHEYSYELPEGAKYFAIRCVSTNVYALFVDDVAFTKFRPNPTGYNVYVDGELVGTTDTTAREFICTDKTAAGEHEFSVTAVYGDSESEPMSVKIEVTAIDDINADSKAVEVHNIQGMRVTGKQMPAGVYIVNGKQVVKK